MLDPGDLSFLTYQPIDLNISNADLACYASEVDSVDDRDWYWSAYRACYILPIFTGGGGYTETEMSNHHLIFEWSGPAKDHLTNLRKFCEDRLLNWMRPYPRIVIIKTPARSSLLPHIDCSEEAFDDLQHKLRVVLRGPVDSLFFIDKDGQQIYIDSSSPSYIIDGSHLHGMDNASKEDKLTLCAGSPWQGQSSQFYKNLLCKGKSRFPGSEILRNKIGRPYPTGRFKTP